MNSKHRYPLLVVCIATFVAMSGCAAEEKPQELSYAEALSIYNAELETLQRLQAQRSALQEKVEPSAEEMLGGLLGEASKMAGELRGEIKQSIEDVDDPAGTATELEDPTTGENVLGELSNQLEGQAVASDAGRAVIEAQIAKLDEEIAGQELRVERARADRDAAEARRNAAREQGS